MKNILVTGGCGFIGSAFLNHMLPKYPNLKFINLDKLDYCAREKNVSYQDNYTFVKGNIGDSLLVLTLLNQYNIDTVVHFAAYSHVDNSFNNSVKFTENNVVGTHKLLEACRVWNRITKFIHVSTDEVYGEIEDGIFHEKAILSPTNPYAASKAAAEMVVLSYQKSFKMPIIITRGNNVYGPRQYPEKLIPKFILNMLSEEPCPIHGSGENIRNFIHCDDVARAFETILVKGKIGEVYNIGSSTEFSVNQIAEQLQRIIRPKKAQFKKVQDRAFNDIRYAIDVSKLKELGWKPTISWEQGLKKTVEWYSKNSDWFKE
jgi:UDP-glucose 4,6-dehydratase